MPLNQRDSARCPALLACGALMLAMLAGCGGGKKAGATAPTPSVSATTTTTEVPTTEATTTTTNAQQGVEASALSAASSVLTSYFANLTKDPSSDTDPAQKASSGSAAALVAWLRYNSTCEKGITEVGSVNTGSSAKALPDGRVSIDGSVPISTTKSGSLNATSFILKKATTGERVLDDFQLGGKALDQYSRPLPEPVTVGKVTFTLTEGCLTKDTVILKLRVKNDEPHTISPFICTPTFTTPAGGTFQVGCQGENQTTINGMTFNSFDGNDVSSADTADGIQAWRIDFSGGEGTEGGTLTMDFGERAYPDFRATLHYAVPSPISF